MIRCVFETCKTSLQPQTDATFTQSQVMPRSHEVRVSKGGLIAPKIPVQKSSFARLPKKRELRGI